VTNGCLSRQEQITRFTFPFSRIPERPVWLKGKLVEAADRLATKLSRLSLGEGAISPFASAYLQGKLKEVGPTLQRNVFVLAWALTPLLQSMEMSRVVMVDYGAGVGDLSLLAKEVGVGTVVYTDIYDVMCRDARHIARSVGLEANHYVAGEVNVLLKFLQEKRWSCGAMVSYDVLEHMYDLEEFLMKVPGLSSGHLVLAMASSANPKNPLIARRLKKLQRKMEFHGTVRKEGEDPRDTPLAYRPLRRALIAERAGGLSPEAIDLLTLRTRGMRLFDIEQALETYKGTGMLPPAPEHPTNTCDPFTGNWCERLLDPWTVAGKLRDLGFSARVLPGYYGSHGGGSRLRRGARLGANMAIRALGVQGLPVAPFYCVHAVRGAMTESS
jgi:2-polyprenyl-3-methyl-5-hydroxy-6-metoxy-1,4-benzoquinol methylase